MSAGSITSIPGDPRRLGASPGPDGTNFAVFSSAAARAGSVSLVLVDDGAGGVVERELPMWCEQDVWACQVAGVAPGQRYGYRVHGPGAPADLLLDPYAHAMTPADPAQPRRLHGLVIDSSHDWGDDRPPDRRWSDTVLYEVHVKGLTARHPDVPPQLRGTYAGLAHPAVLEHLVGLGVTALELMPVCQFVPEQRLLDLGLTNYWGYSTIGFLAPHAGYSSSGTRGQQVAEFQAMVRAVHAAGLEVVLDVVFNHSAEGAADGPALSFRGLADDVYYRRDPDHPDRYADTSGTGNSLDTGRPEVLRLVFDALRWWVTQMHVDGFRFDLAASLARQHGSFDRLSAFFDLVHQEPVLSGVKLIAEPWDVGAGDSYQVGRFPLGWVEWNDKYRDTVRDFWRGRAAPGALATRVAGSSDLYAATRRGPDASVSFVTAHDGMTLADLVSYERKHNDANGEQGRDGAPDDRSVNHGVEGPTDDPAVRAARARHRRALLATLLVSQGVPMLAGGDELCRTQQGNDNAYCQDGPLTWHDWAPDPEAAAMTAFVRRAVGLQAAQPTLRRRTFLTGSLQGGPLPDVGWYGPDGLVVTGSGWEQGGFLAWLLAGDLTDLLGPDGSPLRGDDVLVVANSASAAVAFPLPGRPGARWTIALDSTTEDGLPTAADPYPVGAVLDIPPLALLVAVAPLPG